MALGNSGQRGSAAFPETSWGLVLAAGNDSGGRAAFAELCRRYWTPIYASLRRHGFASAKAEDLTQSFFLRLIEDRTIERAESERGRFRSFLLGALRRFLSDDRERESALKRGGGEGPLPLDIVAIESRLAINDDEVDSLDLEFDRQWAQTLVDNALQTLRDEHVRSGQGDLFELLQSCLDPGAAPPSYEQIAKRLDRNEGAVKTAVHRLRRRFRENLRREVEVTVADPREIDKELAYLRDVLAAAP